MVRGFWKAAGGGGGWEGMGGLPRWASTLADLGFAAFPPSLWEIGPRGSPCSTGYRAIKSPRYPRGRDSEEGNVAGVKGCFPVLDQPVRSLEELPFGRDCGSSVCALSTLLLLASPRVNCPVQK